MFIKATEVIKSSVVIEEIETSIKPANNLYDTTCMTHDLFSNFTFVYTVIQVVYTEFM